MEEYLGSTKYDGKIRRITLIKRVSDKMDMKDGDFINFYKIGNDIVIRKQESEKREPLLHTIIPKETSKNDRDAIWNAGMKIQKEFEFRKTPDNMEMLRIIKKAFESYPEEYTDEKKMELFELSVKVAKSLCDIKFYDLGEMERHSQI